MPTLAPDRIIELLQARDFNSLRGTPEHEEVECNSAPYRLQDESQRIELAKDIAGLANADGGIILAPEPRAPDALPPNPSQGCRQGGSRWTAAGQ